MKNIFFFIVLLYLSSFSTLKASHYYGASLSYEHLGGCMYRIYQAMYYDCSGTGCLSISSYPPPQSINISGIGCNINAPSLVWVLDTANYGDIIPVCAGTPTNCNTASGSTQFTGVVQVIYYADVSLCSLGCSSILLSLNGCCRSYGLTNGSSGSSYYTETIIQLGINNSSPKFIELPITYINAGQTQQISQVAFDKDGDSLVYSIVPALQSAAQPINYSPGYSTISPLGPSWNVSMNAQTGLITFIAQSGNIQVGVVNIKVDEYRNNVLIGSIYREMMISVVNSSFANNPPTFTINNITGGYYMSTPPTFQAYNNTSLSFDISISDPNLLDFATYTSNYQSFMPNASITNTTPITSNPLILHFSWTPSTNDVGKHFPLLIQAKDSHCPLYAPLDIFADIKVDDITISASTTPSACNFPSGAVNLNIQGGVPPFSYSWNNGATTQHLTNVPMGTYWVTVTNNWGNSWLSDTFYVNSSAFTPSPNLSSPNCNLNDGSISLNVSGGQPPYTYLWSNGGNTSTISNLGVGGYTATVTDAAGCFYHQTFLLNYDINDSCFSSISGNVFFDADQNCILGGLEMGLEGILVYCNNGNGTLTDANGNYSLIVQDTGNYTVQCFFNTFIPSISNCNPIPFTQNLHIGSLGANATNIDFGVHIPRDIQISLSDFNYNPGFFHHSNILCKNISYYNLDTVTVIYQHDSAFSNLSFYPPCNTYDSATKTAVWFFPNFNIGAVQFIVISGITNPNSHLGDTVKNYVSILPTNGDFYPQNNQDTIICVVNGSFDPNSKEVFPQGETQYGFVSPNTQELEYTINFQNTGNYPAQFVVIKDTIAADKLRNMSFILSAYSHDCTVKLEQDSILTFTFANINLPDSTSDEPNSHGFVKYKIKINPNLPLNVPIQNRASIYFDFNAPILTDAVMSTLYAPMQLSVMVDSVICPQDLLSAWVQQGSPPYAFSWSNGVQVLGNINGFSQVSPNFSNGIQSIQVTDAFGMSVSQSFNANLQAISDANFTYYNVGNDYGFVASSAQNTTYFWNFGNGQTSTQMNPFVHFTQSGAYHVSLIVTDNCGGRDTVSQIVYVVLTDLENAFSASAQLSPNPFSQFSLLSFANFEKDNYTLIIRDLSGREVQKIENIRTNEVKIERMNKAKGTYIWELLGKYHAKGLMIVE